MAKRNELSLDQKVRVLEALECKNQSQVAAEFGISQSAVSRIKSREYDIFLRWQEMPDRKRTRRVGKYANSSLNLSTMKFYEEQRATGNPLTMHILKDKVFTAIEENARVYGPSTSAAKFDCSEDYQRGTAFSSGTSFNIMKSPSGYIVSQFKELVDDEGYFVSGGEPSKVYVIN